MTNEAEGLERWDNDANSNANHLIECLARSLRKLADSKSDRGHYVWLQFERKSPFSCYPCAVADANVHHDCNAPFHNNEVVKDWSLKRLLMPSNQPSPLPLNTAQSYVIKFCFSFQFSVVSCQCLVIAETFGVRTFLILSCKICSCWTHFCCIYCTSLSLLLFSI